MSRANAAAKARTYLSEGRVVVTHASRGRAAATVRGDGHLWHARFLNGIWSCDCPARTPSCAHLIALRLITAPDLEDR